METRIKTLYIITIIAILSFLAMQAYWLYNRYEFSLKEYERNLSVKIAKCVDDYNDIRNKLSDINPQAQKILTVPKFSLEQKYGDTVKTTRTAKIFTYQFSAYELLGLKPGTPLSAEQQNKAMELAQAQLSTAADSIIFDASGAKDENEAWTATRNVQTEQKCPFTVNGIDSVLNKAGIKAQVNLTESDSMVWHQTVAYHESTLTPTLSVTIPYSQLEGRAVKIICTINPSAVLPGMWQTLIITVIVSTLLIVCLILQFSTVLKFSRLDRMRNSFITTMIHELKRPISTLKMCISGLDNERMYEDKSVRKELLKETRNALDNLSAYFSKLRDITFNNVEQIPLNIQSVNLRDLFENIASATVAPPGKTVVIKNDIADDAIISADRSHLYNVLNNLVENAVKYSGQTVEITASATLTDETAEIRISDTGNGIPSGDLKHIFKRFYRGKTSAGEQPGMGLGLAYVRLLIEAHGGEVAVESCEGRGSCFILRLPQE